MKIQLSNPLKEIHFPAHIAEFWNQEMLGKFSQDYQGYSAFYRADRFPVWERLNSSEVRVCELFEYVAKFHRMEKYDFKKHKDADLTQANYLSLQMLDLLAKQNLDMDEVLVNTYKQDPNNDNGWIYSTFLDVYLQYLDFKGKELAQALLPQFLAEVKENKNSYNHRDVNEEMETFIHLLKVMPQNKVSYEWFSQNLVLFCSIKDEDSKQLLNHGKHLNYDCQKQIHAYVSHHFPAHLKDNEEYYSSLLPAPIFSTKRLYQGVMDINLFQLVHQYQLSQQDIPHLSQIASHCLHVVSSKQFMQLIEQDIELTNLNIQENPSNIILNFSTTSYESLENFEKILTTALAAVLQVHDKIHLRWSESYHGDDELMTNMDAKFVHQHYLYHKLNETVEINNSLHRRKKI